MKRRTRRRWHWPRITRDTVTYIAGLIVLGHATFGGGQSSPYEWASAITLLGLPVAWRAGDKLQQRDTSNPETRGYYRLLEDERRWERDWDRRRREIGRGR